MFAAGVLMPARLIQEQYVRCERDFFRLCDTFGASGAAIGRRLHAVIKTSDSRPGAEVRQSRVNPSAPDPPQPELD